MHPKVGSNGGGLITKCTEGSRGRDDYCASVTTSNHGRSSMPALFELNLTVKLTA